MQVWGYGGIIGGLGFVVCCWGLRGVKVGDYCVRDGGVGPMMGSNDGV